MRKTLGSSKGFTLIELIIVIIILGILAGLVTPKLYSWVKDSRVNTIMQNVAMVEQVENGIYLSYGTLDGSSNGQTPNAVSVTGAIEGALTNGKKLGDMGLWVETVDTANQKVIMGINYNATSLSKNSETVQPLNLNFNNDITSKPVAGYWNNTATSAYYNIVMK